MKFTGHHRVNSLIGLVTTRSVFDTEQSVINYTANFCMNMTNYENIQSFINF